MGTINLGGSGHGFDMDLDAAGLDAILPAGSTSATETRVGWWEDADTYAVFTGRHFVNSLANGYLDLMTAGTVTGVRVVDEGRTIFSATGIKVSAPDVIDAIRYAPGSLMPLITAGNDTITGTRYADVLEAGAGRDLLKGGAGNDVLRGGSGRDSLQGGAGRDWLHGGADGDLLQGGEGADIFVYRSVSESTARTRDTISDFSDAAGDRIHLASIDANETRGGNQDFTFIGAGDFSGTAGELHAIRRASVTTIEADTDGDARADLVIRLAGSHVLDADSLVL